MPWLFPSPQATLCSPPPLSFPKMAQELSYNIAYTVAANKDATPEERLTLSELWQGIKRGGRYPGDFGSFVLNCDVVSGDRSQFVREILIGDGAVHTKHGTKIVQDVTVQEGLLVSYLILPSPPPSLLFSAMGGTSLYLAVP